LPQRSSVRLDVAGQGREVGVSLEDDQNGVKEVETQFVVDSIDGRVNASDVRSPLTEVSSRRRRPQNGDGVGQGAGEELVRSPRRGEEETEGRSRMGGCGACGRRCEGFLTDREQRKVWGIGILYVLGFPLLLLMTVVGGLKAVAPGDPNPDCPAEPNIPWMLILGGTGIGLLLLLRIAIVKCLRCIKNNQTCCDDVAGCFCEFGCNVMYDIMLMVAIVMWMVPVTWWVFRHRVGPDALYSLVGEEQLNNFRASLGDKDKIHVVQFTDPDRQDYCDRTLYMVAFVILTAGWLILACALIVFLVDKIFTKLVCCRLCSSLEGQSVEEEAWEDEENLIKLRPQPSSLSV